MKNKKFIKFCLMVLVSAVVALPMLSFAADTTTKVCSATVQNIGDVICKIGDMLSSVIPILLTLAVIYFIWGVIQYMLNPGAEEKKKGKSKIIYGIIGLVIIVSLWGIVTLVIDGFGLDQQESVLINPANIIDNNVQMTNSNNCFTNYQGAANPKLGDLINYVTCIIGSSVIPLIFTLAVASFVWGVVQYVINDQEEAKKAKGRSFMIWGIIALTVMVSIWGLVRIFTDTFKIDFNVPQVKQQQ